MDKTIYRGRTKGSVTAPPSKSYAQRAIAAALLCRGETVLTNMVYCNDTRAALQVARDLGAEVLCTEDTCTIRGGLRPSGRELNVGESGLATRLFTPVTALCDEEIVLTGEGSLLGRPVSMMEAPLRELGAEISSREGYLPIRVKGPVQGGQVSVDGSLSSQFITGLLMSLPLAERDTTMNVADLKSRPYIDMTIGLLEAFGIEIKHNDYKQFFIEGGQRYTPAHYNIEGDWSGASCLLVAGATAGEATVRNLNPLSLQADTAIIDALTRAGAEITTTRDSVTVRRNELRAFEFDATHCPDLFPALAALAAGCRGTSVLRGTRRLVHKESDRARTIADVFSRMGIDIDLSTENLMRITGGPIRSATVESHNDHRIAMAAATAALNSDDSVVVRRAEAVNKSYPGFWDDLRRLTTEKR
ncbi:3-phosphoshikimate 1-carboxyvinyltransferase [uncultured Alistipes sp.]|uniref:3-phosphoshikimate 1-carboxyvinyltransferase n=1 Tax=uncultured Alistipes sp. TaxID=538949 RepID=UPI0026165375|nr:3-phosphoshikimate 1-carboxyvinyltransferase [uncultured Alistipes sp.]